MVQGGALSNSNDSESSSVALLLLLSLLRGAKTTFDRSHSTCALFSLRAKTVQEILRCEKQSIFTTHTLAAKGQHTSPLTVTLVGAAGAPYDPTLKRGR